MDGSSLEDTGLARWAFVRYPMANQIVFAEYGLFRSGSNQDSELEVLSQAFCYAVRQCFPTIFLVGYKYLI